VAYAAPKVSDSGSGPATPTASCDIPSGSEFVQGQTTVTCYAEDVAGNYLRKGFIVTIYYNDGLR
jgi:hypothetical protein